MFVKLKCIIHWMRDTLSDAFREANERDDLRNNYREILTKKESELDSEALYMFLAKNSSSV